MHDIQWWFLIALIMGWWKKCNSPLDNGRRIPLFTNSFMLKFSNGSCVSPTLFLSLNLLVIFSWDPKGRSILINLVLNRGLKSSVFMQGGTGVLSDAAAVTPGSLSAFQFLLENLTQAADKAKQILLQAALLPSAQDRKTKANAPQEPSDEKNFL